MFLVFPVLLLADSGLVDVHVLVFVSVPVTMRIDFLTLSWCNYH